MYFPPLARPIEPLQVIKRFTQRYRAPFLSDISGDELTFSLCGGMVTVKFITGRRRHRK
jgi:hypothetical protein